MITGCATMLGKSEDQVRALWAKWGERNQQQHIALGERVFDKDFDLVFTGIVTGLSDIGFSIKNMERQSGYILAEGPTPLSAEEEQAISEQMVNEINAVSPTRWNVRLGNATESVTIVVKRQGADQCKVKMRLAVVAVDGNYKAKHSASYPPRLEAEYRKMWQAIQRQIFLDQNLD